MLSKKIYLLIIFFVFTLIVFIYISQQAGQVKQISTIPVVEHELTPITASTPDPEQPAATIDLSPTHKLIASLTLEQKIGQLFIFGFEETSYEKGIQLQKWITDYNIGNFIVFKRNIKSNTQLQSLIESIDNHNPHPDLPIWIGIDQEGGIVNRLPQKYPSAQQFSTWNDTLITYTKHNEMADELSKLGIDINFGPVLDINSNPKNPVINSRAFGHNAETVILHTDVVLDAYIENQILAVGKHYPGHGDTNVDSHYHLPVITKHWDELLELELKPFQHAINKQIPSIMVGHLLLSSVDEQYPASLSSILIQDKLVDELGFSGIIMTDDLIMEGVLNHFTIGEAAVRAIEAGAHMIIIGHDVKKQEEAIQAVKEAYQSGRLSEEVLDAKLHTILGYKVNQQ